MKERKKERKKSLLAVRRETRAKQVVTERIKHRYELLTIVRKTRLLPARESWLLRKFYSAHYRFIVIEEKGFERVSNAQALSSAKERSLSESSALLKDSQRCCEDSKMSSWRKNVRQGTGWKARALLRKLSWQHQFSHGVFWTTEWFDKSFVLTLFTISLHSF